MSWLRPSHSCAALSGSRPTSVPGCLASWWEDGEGILPTTASALHLVLGRAGELDLAGNVHDALIAAVCREYGLGLLTADGRQHRLALALGVDSTYLLATA